MKTGPHCIADACGFDHTHPYQPVEKCQLPTVGVCFLTFYSKFIQTLKKPNFPVPKEGTHSPPRCLVPAVVVEYEVSPVLHQDHSVLSGQRVALYENTALLGPAYGRLTCTQKNYYHRPVLLLMETQWNP